MRVLCLLGLFAILSQAQSNSSNSSKDCAPIVPPPDVIFRPPVYMETNRVSQLSAYTSVDFCSELVSDYKSCSSYTNQLIGLGVAPIVISIIASLSLSCFLCCRSQRCCNCKLPFPKLWMGKAFLGLLLLCSFISIYTSFTGSGDFKTGANNLGRAISNTESTVGNVKTQLEAALMGSEVLKNGSTGIASGTCDDPFYPPSVNQEVRNNGQEILDQIPNVQDPINNVLLQLDFIDTLELIRDAIVNNSERNIDRAFYAIVGIYTLALLFGVLGLVCAPMFLNVELCMGSMNVIIAGVFIGLELGFSVGVSDFCHPNPRVQILSLVSATVGSGPEALSALQYMMTCEGYNPVRNRSEDILMGMSALQNKVCVFASYNSTRPQCNIDTGKANVGLSQLVNSTNLFFNTIASCKFFNEPLVLLTDDAVCTNMVDGLYAMWTSQMVATIFLIMALFVTPCVKDRIHRANDDDPVAHIKKRSSTVAERRDSEYENAAPAHTPAPYVPASVSFMGSNMYMPPGDDGKYEEAAPPMYLPSSVHSEIEMDNVRRDKIGDPVYEG